MSDQEMDQITDGAESEIELLAREADMPVAKVHALYRVEHAKLEPSARIKTYIPVLVLRRVKTLLQDQRATS